MNWQCLKPPWRALTQLVLQVTVLVVFHIFVLVEEVFVYMSPSKQPHVWVVCDGPMSVVSAVERRALSLGLRRGHKERYAKQPQQLLVSNRKQSFLAQKPPHYIQGDSCWQESSGLCLYLRISWLFCRCIIPLWKPVLLKLLISRCQDFNTFLVCKIPGKLINLK